MQFLRGREMPHRKYYKGLNSSAVHTLVRPHALCSGNAVAGLHTAGKTGTGLFREGGRAGGQEAEEDEEALGRLLPLKSPLSSSCQHPPAQGHGVRGRAFRGEESL